MTITLGEFIIANGQDRTVQVLSDETVDMQQQTQVVTLSRDDAPTAFPEHAVRSIPLSYDVTFPACESLEAALYQSRSVMVACPKGGELVEVHEGTQITYAQAWVTGIRVNRQGVTNRFTFSLMATRPDIATPSPLALMDPRYPNVISVTGLTGGETKLDGEITTDVNVGRFVDFYLNVDGFLHPHRWVLTAWTDETEDAEDGRVLPDDFHSTTNPKIWRRLI